MPLPIIPVWKEAPFIRLIIPLIIGILIQWHVAIPVLVYLILIPLSLIFIIVFSFTTSFFRYKNYWLSGAGVTILLLNTGGVIAYYNDLRHFSNCITGLQLNNKTYIVTLTEPLSEKENSYKATAVVNDIFENDSVLSVKGNIIIYFQKDSSLQQLTYNNCVAFRKRLQPINNPGNPGAFDYQRYCAFHQIYYQVYLKPGEYDVLPALKNHSFTLWLFQCRKKIIDILRIYIPGEKEAGLAEALLIGFKDDLDKNLVQSYSNTGVVHIIAISGLHLGLIYWLLNLILRPLKINGRSRWVKAILVISGLWLFSFLAGGSPSVCRSAVMFSFIVMGENIGRKTNIYNSLAASAFILLCFDPFWLWDAGFQLSYIAVLSIVIFMKSLYNWFFIKNKLLDLIWKMVSISIAAQILTTPVSIFLFHQFPNYFLITNLIAVPLSSLIVLAEIVLCAFPFSSYLATSVGGIVYWLIRQMDSFIEYINKMPFPVTNDLQLSLGEIILVYLAITGTCIWMFQKNKQALLFALACISCFSIFKSYFVINARFQNKLVVYNIPHHQAIDLIKGRQCLFLGDSMLHKNRSLQDFYLKPSRIAFRIKNNIECLALTNSLRIFSAGNKRILIINGQIKMDSLRCSADIIILSGTININITELQKMTDCRQLIFDSSNPPWKINKWKEDCEKAGISFYSTAEKGAFILTLN